MKRRAPKRSEIKILQVDPQSQYLEDETSFTIHPAKLNWLGHFEKETFDRAIIRNTPSGNLKALGFFFIAKSLKANSLVEVFVDQPISVMQGLDASEIEANAKLAGFVDIQHHDIETFVKENDKDVRLKSVKLSMVRPDRVSENPELKKK